jgi:hypothetical protein
MPGFIFSPRRHQHLLSCCTAQYSNAGRPTFPAGGTILVQMIASTDYQDLLDYRRSVSRIYAGARGETAGSTPDHAAHTRLFRSSRDALFKNHPKSPPLGDRQGAFLWPEVLRLRPLPQVLVPRRARRRTGDVGDRAARRWSATVATFRQGPLRGRERRTHVNAGLDLGLRWRGLGSLQGSHPRSGNLRGRQAPARYHKPRRLGFEEGRLILDFNYAYNPSCAYNPRWHCPLSPPEISLPARITADEKTTVARSTRGEI